METLDLADLLRRNPQIDVDKLNESIQLTERVKGMMISQANHLLPMPNERRMRVSGSPGERYGFRLPSQR